MKAVIITLAIVAVAAAVPKPTKLNYRNLFKKPIGEIKTRPHPRIIGGQEAEPHSIPYQAFLEVYAKEEAWYCGGSLISENYVLTAAHCGEDLLNSAVEAHVTLGAHKPLETEDTQVVLVSKEVKIHENYDSVDITNDIGLIKLPEAVTLTDAIQLVTLPSSADADNTYEGVSARVSGWGLTDGFGDQLSDVLNYVDVNVINNPECEKSFGELVPSILCTSGAENTGSCSGDSGGPLAVDGVQIGVVSFGVIFCLDGYPSGFTRVTNFLDWVADNSDVVIA
ncbi:Trypsin domain containing protein [Asbolus verrucosus]|uniref:Trypsin domain containing protein n=1 Tax=Asbolus verrucosus TaxID=1661398 RepID=A0A482VTA8_ASBVE|nr:Trypsin domain containing protein [Asbolus verrucosus]